MAEWIGKNAYLTMSEMMLNARYIYDYLLLAGWTPNAICGLLGNMQTESTINPGIWQNLDEGNLLGGFGLVQWTPATKYIDWATANGYLPYTDMVSNIERIRFEVENNIQWGNDAQGNPPPYSFIQYTQSADPPYTLALLFLKHYERPADPNQPIRGTQADMWYEYLTGEIPPQPPTVKKKRMLKVRIRRKRK